MVFQKVLPEDFYRLIPALYPTFFEICRQCGITGPEFFVLSYLRHYGQRRPDNRREMLLAQLDAAGLAGLGKEGSAATDFRGRLLNRGLIETRVSTPRERDFLFPEMAGSGSQSKFIVLTENGEQTLDAFNQKAEEFANAIIPETAVYRMAWLFFGRGYLSAMTEKALGHATNLRSAAAMDEQTPETA